jgi:hypothetical protein
MVSFLANCPQCGVMMAKGSFCSDCNWSEDEEKKADIVLFGRSPRKTRMAAFTFFYILCVFFS